MPSDGRRSGRKGPWTHRQSARVLPFRRPLRRKVRRKRLCILLAAVTVIAAVWIMVLPLPDALWRVREVWDGRDQLSAREPVIVGIASVIDGDTIEIHGKRIRLHGIDAPESSQTCLDGAGQKWRCGQQAALALQDFLGHRTVTCEERDVDRYGRVVGRCLLGDVDINGWLVTQGLALAYRRYSRDYIAAETAARSAGRGMWAGTFEPPWEWRRR